MRKIFVNVDGSSRGNPGESAIGVLVTDDKGQVLEQVSKLIGRATNNVAEYKALLEGIRLARLPRWRVNFVEREINHPAHRLAEQAFRERTRQERERNDLLREISYLLDGLSIDDLRRLTAHVRSLRP